MTEDEKAIADRKAKTQAKNKARRESDPDAIVCPLCVKQISDTGKTEYGDTEPYKARSLVTHFKQAHHTNALGVDKLLGVPPGTTRVCSTALVDKVFRPAGSRGAIALAAKTAMQSGTGAKDDIDLTTLEDMAIEAGVGE